MYSGYEDTLQQPRNNALADLASYHDHTTYDHSPLFGMSSHEFLPNLDDNMNDLLYLNTHDHDPSLPSQSSMYHFDDSSNPTPSPTIKVLPKHIDPTVMWSESANASSSTDTMFPSVLGTPGQSTRGIAGHCNASNRFGQITPPDDDSDYKPIKRVDTLVPSPVDNERVKNKMNGSQPRRNSRTNQRRSKSSSLEIETSLALPDGEDKRERYREKNRVAAAKCRARKKDNVENLEESYKTQSVLHVALKQTEQSLRDELSYWRTQALQHTFCGCRSIQEYNMMKAQALAAGNGFGSLRSKERSSLLEATSPKDFEMSIEDQLPEDTETMKVLFESSQAASDLR